MKKIVIGVLALLLLTGCSNNSSDQTLFVANKKESIWSCRYRWK